VLPIPIAVICPAEIKKLVVATSDERILIGATSEMYIGPVERKKPMDN
jgi:hypothetical protein